MKINIATSGRFHLLDLARELTAQGHEVSFYSFIPRSRCEHFGLDARHVAATFPLCGMVEFVCRKGWLPRRVTRAVRAVNEWMLDHLVAWGMRRCDIFVAASTIYVRSLRAAKRRFGATVLLERGCSHTLAQYAALCATPGARLPSKRDRRRELKGYRLADYIVIPSGHVRASFIEYGVDAKKLFVNPYGMSLADFHPTSKPPESAYDVLMVGGWMYRKGCDLLVEACRNLQLRLLHVGGHSDYVFPEEPWFTHVDAVDEKELVGYYARAKVFALPSREDGFGMVLCQALACGLPIVCSRDTGGPDLQGFLEEKQWIRIMPETTVSALENCLIGALDQYHKQPEGLRDYAGRALEDLTWAAYARRYDLFLQELSR